MVWKIESGKWLWIDVVGKKVRRRAERAQEKFLGWQIKWRGLKTLCGGLAFRDVIFLH